MISLTILPALTLALLATFTSAVPAAYPYLLAPEGDSFILVTFIGAAGAAYSQSIPFDYTVYPTRNALSISKISISGGPCVFYGVDGYAVFDHGVAGTYDIGPPVIIEGGACGWP